MQCGKVQLHPTLCVTEQSAAAGTWCSHRIPCRFASCSSLRCSSQTATVAAWIEPTQFGACSPQKQNQVACMCPCMSIAIITLLYTGQIHPTHAFEHTWYHHSMPHKLCMQTRSQPCHHTAWQPFTGGLQKPKVPASDGATAPAATEGSCLYAELH